MNIQQMKYVVAVANNGSFREAAKKMFVSQPSLSAGIKELETELGITLFTRTNRGAYLTEEGQDFLNRAEKILVQLDTLETHYLTSEKRDNFSIAAQEELLSYPQVRFTQDGNNFPYFYEDLIEIPDQETVIYTSDRGTLMNIVLETDAYASGSGIVIGRIREHLRLIPLAEGELNEFYIIYSAKRPLSEIAQRFIKELTRLLDQQS